MKKSFFNRPIFGILIIVSFLAIVGHLDRCSWGTKSTISAVYSVAFKGKINSIDEGRGIYITFYGDHTRYNVGGFYNSKKKLFLNDKGGFDWGDSLMKKENSDIIYLKKNSGKTDTFQYDTL